MNWFTCTLLPYLVKIFLIRCGFTSHFGICNLFSLDWQHTSPWKFVLDLHGLFVSVWYIQTGRFRYLFSSETNEQYISPVMGRQPLSLLPCEHCDQVLKQRRTVLQKSFEHCINLKREKAYVWQTWSVNMMRLYKNWRGCLHSKSTSKQMSCEQGCLYQNKIFIFMLFVSAEKGAVCVCKRINRFCSQFFPEKRYLCLQNKIVLGL